MKVLIVNTVDSRSGAARAAYRLHQALLQQGIESNMLVQTKLSDDYRVIQANSKKIDFWRKVNSIKNRKTKGRYQIKNDVSFSLANGPDEFERFINKLKPDVIHLHWFNKGFVKLESLKNLKQPVFWTLHDMWAFTGGCHYNQGCQRYQESCGSCPILGSTRQNDLSTKIYSRKQKVYQALGNLNIVTPSKWLGSCADSSTLLAQTPVHVIPNCIDTTVYKPIDKVAARKALNLPTDRKMVMFGALKVNSDPRKGFKHLQQALGHLQDSNLDLMVFGSSKPADYVSPGFDTHFLGRIYDDVSLALIYSAADVMVVPSEQENLGNTIMESLACGTPVVGFDIGGNGDMIDHMQNGYLASAFESRDLAEGIAWVLAEGARWSDLSNNARQKVCNTFNPERVAQSHIKQYQSAMK